MKILKLCTVLLVILTLAAVGFVFVQFQNAKVEVTGVASHGRSAAEDAAGFAELTESVRQGRFLGTVFRTPETWQNASEYALITYSVTLKNTCFLPIERIELQLSPKADDLLQLGTNDVISLNPNEERTVEMRVLANSGSNTVRNIKLSWYLWGKPYFLDVACGG